MSELGKMLLQLQNAMINYNHGMIILQDHAVSVVNKMKSSLTQYNDNVRQQWKQDQERAALCDIKCVAVRIKEGCEEILG